jgi:hypothetical protein
MSAEPYEKLTSLLGTLVLAIAALSLGAKTKPETRPGKTKASPAPPVTNLYPSGAVEFSAPPPAAVSAGTQCDTNGNIYIQIAPPFPILSQLVRSHQAINTPLTRLSFGSQEVVTFPADSAQGYTQFSSGRFYVTPKGAVYNLGQECRQGKDCKKFENWAWIVTRYNDDGSVDSTEELDARLPDGVYLIASHLAAFPDGNLLVAGKRETMEGSMSMKAFTAVFNRAGIFQTDVKLPHDVSPQPQAAEEGSGAGTPRPGSPPSDTSKEEAKAVTQFNRAVVEGQMVASPDGTIYFLRAGSPERLYVIGSDGSVIRERNIQTPRPGLTPFSVSLNGQGHLLISLFGDPTPQGGLYSALAVVDPQTGKVISTYKVPPDAGIPACMTNHGEVLFVRESKSGHLEVAKYTPQ